MAQECIAKSKGEGIHVQMKEKYGSITSYHNLTVVMMHDNCFYLVSKHGTEAILPKANWAIVELINNKPDEDE